MKRNKTKYTVIKSAEISLSEIIDCPGNPGYSISFFLKLIGRKIPVTFPFDVSPLVVHFAFKLSLVGLQEGEMKDTD